MKLANFDLENPYTLNKSVNYFIVENKKKHYEYCKMFIDQANGLDGNFLLSKNNEEISFTKNVFVMHDFLNINLTDRKITSKLHQFTRKIVNEAFVEEFNNLTKAILEFMQIISLDNDFETDYSELLDVSAVLKAVDYKIAESHLDLVPKLIEYISIVINFFNPKLIIFCNLRNLLTDQDCIELNKFFEYNKLTVLFVEPQACKKLVDENFFIIDDDLCELTF